MTTTWRIHNTKRRTSDGLILEVMYCCTATLEEDIQRKVRTITLTGDSTSPDFIPFSDLTEDILLTWVKDSLGETAVTEIENILQSELQARKAAREAETEVYGLPWIQ